MHLILICERGRGERDRDRDREREREKEREGGREMPSAHTKLGDQTCNLGMCLDWEPNLQPFGVRDNAPTEPGQDVLYFALRCPWSI